MRNILLHIFLLVLASSVQAQSVRVANYYGDRQAAVSLTFDDGVQEHYTLVAPHLDRYCLKATFAINGQFIGDIDDHYAPRMTWKECRELVSNGHELANHAWSHKNLTHVDQSALMAEISRNDSIILCETGVFPKSFVYPYNGMSKEIVESCEAGRVGSRTSQYALGQRNSKSTEASINKWVDGLVANQEWGVAMLHGIYTGWDRWDEPWVLWDFFKRLAYRNDTIWTATFSDVQAYVKERDAVVLKTEYRRKVLTISPSIDLDSTMFAMPLTLIIEGMDMSRCVKVVQDGKTLQVTAKPDYYIVDINPYGSPITVSYADHSVLEGKSITLIGDSYVYNHACPQSETWHYKVAAKHGMTYTNLGKNGICIAYHRSRFGEPLCVRYKSIPRESDYIVIVAGHNDAYFVNEDVEQQVVFRERMNELLIGLKRDFPQARIGWVTPWNVGYEGFPATIAIIKELCHKHGIPVLDAARTSGINPNDAAFRSKYFQRPNDTAHLNNAGHDLLIHWGEQFLMGL